MSSNTKSAYLLKKSLTVNGKKTSLALEPEFWDELEKLSAWKGIPRPRLLNEISRKKPADQSLCSAVRVACLLGK